MQCLTLLVHSFIIIRMLKDLENAFTYMYKEYYLPHCKIKPSESVRYGRSSFS